MVKNALWALLVGILVLGTIALIDRATEREGAFPSQTWSAR